MAESLAYQAVKALNGPIDQVGAGSVVAFQTPDECPRKEGCLAIISGLNGSTRAVGVVADIRVGRQRLGTSSVVLDLGVAVRCQARRYSSLKLSRSGSKRDVGRLHRRTYFRLAG